MSHCLPYHSTTHTSASCPSHNPLYFRSSLYISIRPPLSFRRHIASHHDTAIPSHSTASSTVHILLSPLFLCVCVSFSHHTDLLFITCPCYITQYITLHTHTHVGALLHVCIITQAHGEIHRYCYAILSLSSLHTAQCKRPPHSSSYTHR